jgi:hypothetical protein
VLDRPGLEGRTCECYAVVKKEYDRLLPGVTAAATALQGLNLISHERGKMTILDRAGLEGAACGCYQADRDTYARVLGRGPTLPLH